MRVRRMKYNGIHKIMTDDKVLVGVIQERGSRSIGGFQGEVTIVREFTEARYHNSLADGGGYKPIAIRFHNNTKNFFSMPEDHISNYTDDPSKSVLDVAIEWALDDSNWILEKLIIEERRNQEVTF